jgi:Ca2+-binding EF-hand superfamily protein
MEQVEATFHSWDLNNDGAISFTELQTAVARSGKKLSE